MLDSYEQEALDELLIEVPEALQTAYTHVIDNLCIWYGDKAYREIAQWHQCLIPLLDSHAC
jgi:hypothetical protein